MESTRYGRGGLAIVMSLLLTACGGGGSGGDDADEDQANENVNGVSLYLLADKDTDEQLELYKVTLADGAAAPGQVNAKASNLHMRKLSGSMTVGGDVLQMRISPDRRYIAYVADQDVDEKYELYVARTDGSGVTKVSGNFGANADIQNEFRLKNYQNYFFAWSPDSRYLAFTANVDSATVFDLYTVAVDGSQLTKVSGSVLAEGASIHSAVWAPNSSAIAFNAYRGNKNKLFVATPGNAEPVELTAVGEGAFGMNGFAWSPDGSKIAYTADADVAKRKELYLTTPDDAGGVAKVKLSGTMPANGDIGTCEGCTVALEESVNAVGAMSWDAFSWAPNGEWIAYVADAETDNQYALYATATDGASQPIKLSGDLAANEDVNQFDFVWSPDSEHIAFTAESGSSDAFYSNLYVVSRNDALPIAITAHADDEWYVGIYDWAEDGSRLLVTLWQEIEDLQATQILSVTPTGDHVVPIQPIAELQNPIFTANWLNDQQMLVFETGENADGRQRVRVHRSVADGSEINVWSEFDYEGAGGFSDDMKYLGILSNEDDDASVELRFFSTDGRINYVGELGFWLGGGNTPQYLDNNFDFITFE